MKYWKIKKFVMDHKTEIISGTIGVTAITLGAILGKTIYKGHIDLCSGVDFASEGCDSWKIAKPEELWAAFDKDGNLVDALKGSDGRLLDPKMLMVFGNEVKVEP